MVNTPLGSQTNRLVFISPVLSQPLRISGTAMVDMFASFNKSTASVGALIADYAPDTVRQRPPAPATASRLTSAEDCWGESFGIDDACYRIINKTTQTINALTGSTPSGYRVTRGILDAVNRDDYWTDSPLVQDQQYELKFPLLATDYTFPAGHRIGIILVSNYNDYGIRNATLPMAEVTVDTQKSKIILPIVGGYAAAVATGAIPDTNPPSLTLPAPVSVDATGPLTAVTYDDPSATDDEDPNPTASCVPVSGSSFAVGETTVHCEARDGANNVTTWFVHGHGRRRDSADDHDRRAGLGRGLRTRPTRKLRLRLESVRVVFVLRCHPRILRRAGPVGELVRHEHRWQPHVHRECRGYGRQHELGEPDVPRLLGGMVGLLQPDRQREDERRPLGPLDPREVQPRRRHGSRNLRGGQPPVAAGRL